MKWAVLALNSKRHAMKRVVFLASLLILSFLVFLKVRLPSAYAAAIVEDGIVEDAEACIYFLCFILSVVFAVQLYRSGRRVFSLLYVMLGLGFLAICMEEISWGQRIFHIVSPDYFRKENTQAELTVHNLRGIQRHLHGLYMLVGAYGAFMWMIVWRWRRSRFRFELNCLVPDWFLTLYFLPTFFIYLYLDMMTKGIGSVWLSRIPFLRIDYFFVVRDQEPAELLLALGFLLFVVTNALRLRLCKVGADGTQT